MFFAGKPPMIVEESRRDDGFIQRVGRPCGSLVAEFHDRPVPPARKEKIVQLGELGFVKCVPAIDDDIPLAAAT